MRFKFMAGICAGILLGTVTGRSADPAPAAPKTPTVPGVERVTIQLAQFDVVVRDRSGKFVSGLGPSEFKVLEDGSPLEIVAVDEWGRETAPSAAAAAPAPAPPPPPAAAPPQPSTAPGSAPSTSSADPERRSFVIVFDAIDESTALRMNQAKRAATEFVRTRMKPGDVGAVYQLDLSLRAVSGITADRDVLVRGIDKVAWMPATSLADQVNESVLAYESQANAGVAQQRLSEQSAGVAGQLDWQREHIYESLTDLASVFQSLPGKRALILASPGFPMTTSVDARRSSGGFTPKFQKLIKTLATFGVTVYSIDIGSEMTAGDASEAIDWRIAVGKLGMDENVLSDLGLERTLGTNTASSRRQFLGVIAAESGGRMLTDTNLTRSFSTIDEESSHFYRISCRVPVTSAVNRYRAMKVSVTRSGLTVATRRGRYSDVTPFETTSSTGEGRAAVDSLSGYKRLAARGAGFALPAAGAEKLPVVVVLEALGPVDVATNALGVSSIDLDVRIVARAADEVVARYEHGITATLKQGVEAVRAGFRVEGRLELPPGIYEVQGTVRLASPPQLATWTGTVAVPPQKSGAPSVVGPMVILETESIAPLLSQPPTQQGNDPLAVKAGIRFLPATSTEFTTGQSLLLMFWMKDFAPAADAPPPLELSVKLLDAAGAPVTAASSLLYYGRSSGSALSAIVRLDGAALQAGMYVAEVSVVPPGGKAIVRRTAPIVLGAGDARPAVAAKTTSSSTP
jgi:VWFA-related protein